MSFIRKKISRLKWLLHPIQTDGKRNNVNIGCKRNGHLRIYIKGNNNCITVEKDVLLYDLQISIIGDCNNVVISRQCRVYNIKLDISGNNSEFFIGENAGVRQANIVIWENQSVVIEKDAMLSYGINIRTSDSHPIFDLENGMRCNEAKSVYIGEHAWVAQNVTVLKGANIGAHSVVGFVSICSKPYPAHCIIAGIPGKIIKHNIDWKRKLN